MNDPSSGLPWAGRPYSIKRYGVTINNCDTEPVQTPGCIQAHGALLVARVGDGIILQISDNVHDFLGFEVAELLGKPLRTALGDDAETQIRETLRTEAIEHNPLYVCNIHTRNGTRPRNRCRD